MKRAGFGQPFSFFHTLWLSIARPLASDAIQRLNLAKYQTAAAAHPATNAATPTACDAVSNSVGA